MTASQKACLEGAPCVSAIVVSYFTGPVLFRALEALLQQSELGEAVLVDNGNPPDVLESLHDRAQTDGRLRVISGHGNVGFAAGCNLGATASSFPYLLFLNPDCELATDALGLLVDAGQRLDPPWLLSGRLTNPDGSEQRGSRRADLTPRTMVVEGLRLDRLMPGRFGDCRLNLHEGAAQGALSQVPVISGACMFLSKKDFDHIGGWDEAFFLHVEDIDFCRRFRESGGRIYHLSSALIHHQGSSSQAPAAKVEWHKTQGFFKYLNKHFSQDLSFFSMSLLKAMIMARFFVRSVWFSLRK
ncbi:MAG: glycosyltransferase family 2 protein [Pseudomonadota bacterium]